MSTTLPNAMSTWAAAARTDELAIPQAAASGRCSQCAHFRNAPKHLELNIAGLSSMSSGFAAIRWNDGLCVLHQRYLTARSWCPQFRAAAGDASSQANGISDPGP